MTIVVALLAAAVGGIAGRLTLGRLIPIAPLATANYRGIRVPTGLGISVIGGFAAALGFLALVAEIAESAAVAGAWLMPLAAAGAFGVLGLWDDVLGALRTQQERGLRAHLEAIGKGRLTGGGLKLIAGSAVGFALAAPVMDGLLYALAGGAVIALSANLVNSFDVRPGRACKAFLAGAIPLAAMGGALRATICGAAGAVLSFLPSDLRERAMLGDAGSNALGGVLGAATVLLASRSALLIVLGVQVVLTAIAEGPTLSRMIASIPPLRAADAWGRIPEESPDDVAS